MGKVLQELEFLLQPALGVGLDEGRGADRRADNDEPILLRGAVAAPRGGAELVEPRRGGGPGGAPGLELAKVGLDPRVRRDGLGDGLVSRQCPLARGDDVDVV